MMAGVSRRWKWAFVAVNLTVALAILAWVPLWLVDIVAATFPGIVWRGETRQAEVAITFDDGPHPQYTPQVLDILKRHSARATFFLVGENARRYPELVERIRAEGHEIGNHTDSRRTTVWMGANSFLRSLETAEATLELGNPPAASAEDSSTRNAPTQGLKLLRPAGGLIRPAQLAEAHQQGYTVVLGSAYAWDGRMPPPAGYIRWVIAKNLRPGTIVVLHDAGGDASNSIAALDGILEAGAKRGLKWVTLSELLDSPDR